MIDVELLSAAMRAVGMGPRRFAKVILVRDVRSVQRWLKGEKPIPLAVREKCVKILARARAPT